MTLAHNPFINASETLFITYDEIIRNPYPLLLYQVITKYRDIYEPFLELGTLEEYDMPNLTRYCIQRGNRNPFVDLAKKPFDYYKALGDLSKKSMDLYTFSDLFSIGNSLKMLMSQKFTEKIYVYSEVYDVRIHLDLQRTYQDMSRINYVSGDFVEVIKKVENVTCFMLNDIFYVPYIFEHGKAEKTNILVAQYGYNYRMNEHAELVPRVNMEKYKEAGHQFEFGLFMPQELTEAHFSQVEKG